MSTQNEANWLVPLWINAFWLVQRNSQLSILNWAMSSPMRLSFIRSQQNWVYFIMLWGWRALVKHGWLLLCTGYNASQRKVGIWSLRKIIWVVTGSASCREEWLYWPTKIIFYIMSFFRQSRVGYNGIES